MVVAMVVGSFGSVSLDPPLVMFMPAKSSSTWPKIERARHFAASILSRHQQPVCDRIVAKRRDHWIVVAEVLEPGAAELSSPPLVFWSGTYQTLAPAASEFRDASDGAASAVLPPR